MGSSPFSVGSLLGGLCPLSAALRLLKVECDINGILPAGGGPLHIYFVSLLIRLRCALGGNGILRSTARCARSSLRSVKRKSFWDFVLLGSDGPSFSLV